MSRNLNYLTFLSYLYILPFSISLFLSFTHTISLYISLTQTIFLLCVQEVVTLFIQLLYKMGSLLVGHIVYISLTHTISLFALYFFTSECRPFCHYLSSFNYLKPAVLSMISGFAGGKGRGGGGWSRFGGVCLI